MLALEHCLQALERGETIDAAVARYPALADELRPILEASLEAQDLGRVAVPREVQTRGLDRVLRAAAQMRVASRARPRERTWVFALRPLAIVFLLAFFFLSGTGLVSASSSALPGDNLYPVKRTWEDVQLFFAPPQKRETLHMQFEQERVTEVEDLFSEGRSEVVSFSGYVTSQTAEEWIVSEVAVKITPTTNLPTEAVPLGRAVTVTGLTHNGFIEAHSIALLSPNVVIPTPFEVESHEKGGDDNKGNEENTPQNNDGGQDESNDGNETQQPPATSAPTPKPTEPSDDNRVKIEGTLQQMNGSIWTINGRSVDVSNAQVQGNPVIGAKVKVEGYKNANGVIVATKISFDGSGDTGGGGSGGGSNITPTPTKDD